MKTTKKEILEGVEFVTAKLVANNTVLYTAKNGSAVIRLHKTDIITRKPDGAVILSSGGWRTPTTKERLGQFGYPVSQHRGSWTLHWHGKDYDWQDGITILPDGTVTGAAPEGQAKANVKLARKISAYARKFAAALVAGEVPAPSAGDCFGCSLRTEDGGEGFGTDHYFGHIEEGYFVPSLLVNAHQAFPFCTFAQGAMHRLWNEKAAITKWEKEILTRDATRSITRFLKRKLGIAG